MLEKLKKLLSSEAPDVESLQLTQEGEPTTGDLQIATTVLLVDIAAGDGQVDNLEGIVVAKLLARQFEIPHEEIPELAKCSTYDACKNLDGACCPTVSLTSLISL